MWKLHSLGRQFKPGKTMRVDKRLSRWISDGMVFHLSAIFSIVSFDSTVYSSEPGGLTRLLFTFIHDNCILTLCNRNIPNIIHKSRKTTYHCRCERLALWWSSHRSSYWMCCFQTCLLFRRCCCCCLFHSFECRTRLRFPRPSQTPTACRHSTRVVRVVWQYDQWQYYY